MLTLQSRPASVLQGSENQSSGTISKKSGDGSKRSLSQLMLHSALTLPPKKYIQQSGRRNTVLCLCLYGEAQMKPLMLD